MSYKEIELLKDALSSMPTISKKSADKIIDFLLKQDKIFISELVSRLVNLRENITTCPNCNNISTNGLNCLYCNDEKRKNQKLIIVNNYSDIEKIEQSNVFDGLYFVLGVELNLKSNNTSSIDSKYEQLQKMINKFGINNILIATNLTINGELTANYLFNKIKKQFKENVNVYRLATGMPLNSSLDYIDIDSLKYSILNKTKIED